LLPFLGNRLARWALPVLREIHTAADPFADTADALAEIDRDPSRPFLVTVFYSSPHFPYSAPAPYYRQFADPAYRGRYRYSKAQVLGQEAPPDADDIRQIRALFDGAVAATDAAIGELLDGLEARGLLENTIVVLTADHGEGLFEAERSPVRRCSDGRPAGGGRSPATGAASSESGGKLDGYRSHAL
jgi:arylsulfatase A-like enzyme